MCDLHAHLWAWPRWDEETLTEGVLFCDMMYQRGKCAFMHGDELKIRSYYRYILHLWKLALSIMPNSKGNAHLSHWLGADMQ